MGTKNCLNYVKQDLFSAYLLHPSFNCFLMMGALYGLTGCTTLGVPQPISPNSKVTIGSPLNCPVDATFKWKYPAKRDSVTSQAAKPDVFLLCVLVNNQTCGFTEHSIRAADPTLPFFAPDAASQSWVVNVNLARVGHPKSTNFQFTPPPLALNHSGGLRANYKDLGKPVYWTIAACESGQKCRQPKGHTRMVVSRSLGRVCR